MLEFQTSLVPQFRANIQEIIKYIQVNQNYQIYFVTDNQTFINELQSYQYNNAHIFKDCTLTRGLQIDNTVILTEFELFNKQPVNHAKKSKSNIQYIQNEFIPISLDNILLGDYLVHVKHGISKFLELKQLEWDGKFREYISLEFANGEILNTPVDQMNLLSVYKGMDNPKLSKLGSASWEKAKTNARASVKKIAEGLVELYAERQTKTGYAMSPDTPWQNELETNFPYTETPDQLQSIQEIKDDLESSKIMDRLLCGDVGFGKTEVIVRSAFKAIMSGYQVALMAPTTILVHQHYKYFVERLGDLPVKLAVMSRQSSTAEKKHIQDQLSTGDLDLVIGTHVLLNKSLKFHKLGLLIIDEEQKFGVNHKEKLKALKADVKVLTVSATPIPRTLNMALSGIREMSQITTPPAGRVPIKTQLIRQSDDIIRATILRELERGGQVFYLHNRVESIERKALEIMNFVPEATCKIAHGQMAPKESETILNEFINHEFDVLIATSIIENGLDIPNANTMIIEDANRFGLAQLYQLRGRVGRSNDPTKPGHAVLMHNGLDSMSESAVQKLEAITRYTSLGSGYQIALKDMEIRGIGNLLGAEQHGRKAGAIGYELYIDLLKEAIADFKSKLSNSDTDLNIATKPVRSHTILEDKPVLELDLEAYIPDNWIENTTHRLSEYRRLSHIDSVLQLESLMAEWTDRFGKIPEPVNTLITISRVRILADNIGITGKIKANHSQCIELNIFITLDQWQSLYKAVQKSIQGRLSIRFANNLDSPSTLLFKVSGLQGYQQLNALESIFKQLI